MEPQTDKPQSSKALEAVIDQLEYQLETAQGYAANMSQKASTLEYFDAPPTLKEEKEIMKEGYLGRLLKLTETLTTVNERNKETLIHLDRLL